MSTPGWVMDVAKVLSAGIAKFEGLMLLFEYTTLALKPSFSISPLITERASGGTVTVAMYMSSVTRVRSKLYTTIVLSVSKEFISTDAG